MKSSRHGVRPSTQGETFPRQWVLGLATILLANIDLFAIRPAYTLFSRLQEGVIIPGLAEPVTDPFQNSLGLIAKQADLAGQIECWNISPQHP